MPLPNPMEAFQLGQAGGVANSPTTGIGIAIKRVVEDAQKKGLLQAQSQFQGEATNQANILKEGRAETALGQPKSTQIVSPTSGEVINTVEGTRGGDVKVAPAENPLNAIMAEIFKGFTGGGGDETTVTPPSAEKPGLMDNIIPKKPGLVTPDAPAAAAQEGDDELITIKYSDGTTAEMTVGQARAQGLL